MRFAGFVPLAAVSLGLAGCTSTTAARTAADAPTIAAVSTAGGKAAVCAAIRTGMAAHMRPLGTALGQYIGYRAASDAPDERVAAGTIKAELAALADAISSAGATATDPTLKAVTASTATALSGLGDDATLFTLLAQMSDIPGALGRLAAAVQPVTDACS